ncbi:MAG TPA: AzlC family ABC transporter permease [Candidatus Limnocylindria bacterium]|nr:AzlC family ABC transporter permease [Candidatus Limnocylindria bacterium]
MRASARDALIEGWPLFLTSFVIGVPFGIAARRAGLGAIEASGMSVIVFAGAAQFAMLDLFARGAPAALVVATALLINLRHLLMATAMRPFAEGRALWQRLAIAYVLTDESFAMGIGRLRRGTADVAYYLTFAFTLWLAWNAATIVGATLGGAVTDPDRLGLDFAITGAFIAIVVLGIRDRVDVAVALAAALAAGALRLAGASSVAVVAAGAIAPLVAAAVRRVR